VTCSQRKQLLQFTADTVGGGVSVLTNFNAFWHFQLIKRNLKNWKIKNIYYSHYHHSSYFQSSWFRNVNIYCMWITSNLYRTFIYISCKDDCRYGERSCNTEALSHLICLHIKAIYIRLTRWDLVSGSTLLFYINLSHNWVKILKVSSNHSHSYWCKWSSYEHWKMYIE
jgi:hypothetical protein